MLKHLIQHAVHANPEYATITTVLEKEILHHDILHVLIEQGVMQKLTFIGGTSLRLCYNSSRLSEDLDFNGGDNFKPATLAGLETILAQHLQRKYETEVWVSPPNEMKQGNTSSWKISIAKEANRPDLPRQKMHIDVCAIPSFDIQKKALLNHYQLMVPTEGLLIPVQSLQETLVDKLIALAYRTRRIKPRDVWDLVWIRQHGIEVSSALLTQKLTARQQDYSNFLDKLQEQLQKILHDPEVHRDFQTEMSRFVPQHIKERTLDQVGFWEYVQSTVNASAQPLIDQIESFHPFNMRR